MKLATSLVAFATLFASLAQAQLNAPPSLRRSTLVVAAEVDVCVDIKVRRHSIFPNLLFQF